MIRRYAHENGRLRQVDVASVDLQDVVWIDMIGPTEEEESLLEGQLAVDLPTREEMAEIEVSSRLYYENGAAFMTATIPAQSDSDAALTEPVTFVLVGDRLVTIRYHAPRAFETFAAHASRVSMGCTSGRAVLFALLEAIIDRLADILERCGREIDRTSHSIFEHTGSSTAKSHDFRELLKEIGRKGDLTSNLRDSLVTIERLIGFLTQMAAQGKGEKEARSRLRTMARDARSLTDHASFLSQKITFLLEATLGMINIEQNAIIKIFSVAAVVFLPPTLIASIYGMNFAHMPELAWVFGYPMALLMMIVSAIMPYLYFKRRGWL